MDMEKPKWLDQYFVQDVLQNAENDEFIEVFGMTVSPATVKGDNYASDMYRISVELSRIHKGQKITEIRSIIAKLPLRGDPWSEMILNGGLFEMEMFMTVEILPVMNQMLAKFSTTSLSARCLQVQYENPMYLIIEDLAPRGFQMAERGMGLDLDHCLIAIRNIAIFHAASVAFAEKPGNLNIIAPRLRKTEFKRGVGAGAEVAAYITKSTRALGEEVANWPELSPRISRKILKLSDFIWEKQCEASGRLRDDFNVLNHGDCTKHNMMFRYDEQLKPIEQIFVDFQVCRYGSPAEDILTFIGSSPTVGVRFDDRDSLLREYHNSLTSTMAKLKCTTKPPSFNNLQGALRKHAFFEVPASFRKLPLILLDRSKVRNLNEFLESNEKPDHPAYRGEMYRKIMTRVLPTFDSMGLLDV